MESTAIKTERRNLVSWGAPEERLLARARRDGDSRAMDELVQQMMPLARRLAHKYQRPGDELDDLVQVASMALFRALQRFDPDRGSAFPSFAVPTIIGELKRYHRDFGWSVRVPRSLQERALRVKRELNVLSSELGRSPTPAELAARSQLSIEEALEARLAADAYVAASLDAPADQQSTASVATHASEDRGYQLVEDIDALRPAIQVLPERERWILALRFGDELTQNEIANRIGISQMHVSRLLQRALDRIEPILAQAA